MVMGASDMQERSGGFDSVCRHDGILAPTSGAVETRADSRATRAIGHNILRPIVLNFDGPGWQLGYSRTRFWWV
jgi:hypothetical protein